MTRSNPLAVALIAAALVGLGYAAGSRRAGARPVELEPAIAAVEKGEPGSLPEPVRFRAPAPRPERAEPMVMQPVRLRDAVLSEPRPVAADALLMAEDFCGMGHSMVTSLVRRSWPAATNAERDAVLPLAKGAKPCVAAVLYNLHAAGRFDDADVRQWIEEGLIPDFE